MSWSSRLTIRVCALLMLLAGAALSSSPPVAAAAATAYVGAIGDGTAAVSDCAAQANTDCTLRNAIAAAGGAGATVRFGTNFPAGAQTITLGMGAGQGTLTLAASVAIVGPTGQAVAVDGANAVTFFAVNGG
jgi:hypothetical protein